MRGVIMHAPRDVRVEDRQNPTIIEPTDAIIRIAASCICGSDLWPYRGTDQLDDTPMGHEYVGIVTEIGDDVRDITHRRFRRRIVLRLRQHLRDLPGRLSITLRARHRAGRHPGGVRPHPVRRRNPRRDTRAA